MEVLLLSDFDMIVVETISYCVTVVAVVVVVVGTSCPTFVWE